MDSIDFKIKTICDISFFNEEGDFLLSGKGSETFYQEKLRIVIEDLSIWVKEKHFLSWDEDDVNFLNFALRSKYLYGEGIFDAHKDSIKQLYLSCITPLILFLKKKDPFFDDLSFWFITRGENIYKKLSLNDDLMIVSKHFEKEKLE